MTFDIQRHAHHSFRSDFQLSIGGIIDWERGALHLSPPPFRETECQERGEEFPACLHSYVGKPVASHSSEDIEFDDSHPQVVGLDQNLRVKQPSFGLKAQTQHQLARKNLRIPIDVNGADAWPEDLNHQVIGYGDDLTPQPVHPKAPPNLGQRVSAAGEYHVEQTSRVFGVNLSVSGNDADPGSGAYRKGAEHAIPEAFIPFDAVIDYGRIFRRQFLDDFARAIPRAVINGEEFQTITCPIECGQ